MKAALVMKRTKRDYIDKGGKFIYNDYSRPDGTYQRVYFGHPLREKCPWFTFQINGEGKEIDFDHYSNPYCKAKDSTNRNHFPKIEFESPEEVQEFLKMIKDATYGPRHMSGIPYEDLYATVNLEIWM